jgi:hypothetical protein
MPKHILVVKVLSNICTLRPSTQCLPHHYHLLLLLIIDNNNPKRFFLPTTLIYVSFVVMKVSSLLTESLMKI